MQKKILADKLIQNGIYKSVLIISSSIGGTPISRWQRDGDLNEMVLNVIRQLKSEYKITQVIWYQGESDYINKTSAKIYMKMFNSLVETLRENNVNAPIFIAIATKCGGKSVGEEQNPTAIGQHQLVDNKNIFLGVNTDLLLSPSDRQADGCHFRETGQLKTVESLAKAIGEAR